VTYERRNKLTMHRRIQSPATNTAIIDSCYSGRRPVAEIVAATISATIAPHIRHVACQKFECITKLHCSRCQAAFTYLRCPM